MDVFQYHSKEEALDRFNLYHKHLIKLQEIKKGKPFIKTPRFSSLDHYEESSIATIANNKSYMRKFTEREGRIERYRENESLLKKLLTISQNRGLSSGPSSTLHENSSQIGNRLMKETKNISAENVRILNRILQSHSMLSSHKYEEEYKKVKEIKKRIQRGNRMWSKEKLKLPSLKKKIFPTQAISPTLISPRLKGTKPTRSQKKSESKCEEIPVVEKNKIQPESGYEEDFEEALADDLS